MISIRLVTNPTLDSSRLINSNFKQVDPPLPVSLSLDTSSFDTGTTISEMNIAPQTVIKKSRSDSVKNDGYTNSINRAYQLEAG